MSFQSLSSCAFCEQGVHLAAPLLILLMPRVARAQRAVWLPCLFFSSNNTLKSRELNQVGRPSWGGKRSLTSFC